MKTAWRAFVVMTACKCSDDALFVTRDFVTVRFKENIENPCDLQNEFQLN